MGRGECGPVCLLRPPDSAKFNLMQADMVPMARPVLTPNRPACAVGPVSWERMIRAVERVRDRLYRAVAALEAAGVPYAVVGGNAVAAWVSRVEETAARNTRDVDILLRRSDLPVATAAMLRAGFIHRHAAGLDMFLDGPTACARDAVRVVFAAEKARPASLAPAPDVTESEAAGSFRLVRLEALVRMKLAAFRDKDRVHVRDLIDVGLLDSSWLRRLQSLLDNPED